MMKKWCLVLFFCSMTLAAQEGYPRLQVSGDAGNTFTYHNVVNEENVLNPDNSIASIPLWKDRTFFSLNGNFSFSRYLRMHCGMEGELLKFDSDGATAEEAFQLQNHPETYSLNLNRLSIEGAFFTGLVILEVGKTMIEYGSGYLMKPTNFLYEDLYVGGDEWTSRSKYLVRALVLLNGMTLEGVYAPHADWIPDDYASRDILSDRADRILLRAGAGFGSHDFNLLYFYNGNTTVGLNYSVQLSQSIILYSEGVVSNDRRNVHFGELSGGGYDYRIQSGWYGQFLAGISYSPEFIDWTGFLEFLYNGDGLNEDDWREWNDSYDRLGSGSYPEEFILGLRGQGLNSVRYNRMSPFYLGLHLRQNDQFWDHFRVQNTLFVTWPLGFYNQLGLQVEFAEFFLFEAKWSCIPYRQDLSEYSVFLSSSEISLSLTCSF